MCPGLIRTGSPSHAVYKGKQHSEHTWFALSDSLPQLSVSIQEAARAILAAAREGKGTAIVSFPAKVLTVLNGLFPGLVTDTLGVVNRWLPTSSETDTGRVSGLDSLPRWVPSILSEVNKKAIARNNQ